MKRHILLIAALTSVLAWAQEDNASFTHVYRDFVGTSEINSDNADLFDSYSLNCLKKQEAALRQASTQAEFKSLKLKQESIHLQLSEMDSSGDLSLNLRPNEKIGDYAHPEDGFTLTIELFTDPHGQCHFMNAKTIQADIKKSVNSINPSAVTDHVEKPNSQLTSPDKPSSDTNSGN